MSLSIFEEDKMYDYDELIHKDQKKVLVVDDITYIVKSISGILRSMNYFVFTAKTAKDAVKLFKNYTPDLITIDQKLPDMTGIQLVEEIRTLPGGKDVKIIFISAVHDKAQIKKILGMGISNYILKPFRKQVLLDTIKELIG
jgi:DNA-binding response OmpR family regulator